MLLARVLPEKSPVRERESDKVSRLLVGAIARTNRSGDKASPRKSRCCRASGQIYRARQRERDIASPNHTAAVQNERRRDRPAPARRSTRLQSRVPRQWLTPEWASARTTR